MIEPESSVLLHVFKYHNHYHQPKTAYVHAYASLALNLNVQLPCKYIGKCNSVNPRDSVYK